MLAAVAPLLRALAAWYRIRQVICKSLKGNVKL